MALAVENTSITTRHPAAKRGCVSKAMSTSGAPPRAAIRRCNRTNAVNAATDAAPQASVQAGH